MAEQFDPYYTWFGIPPEEQPPDHYRLLGVRALEANDEVIVNATDQRMAYLRTFQVGKRAKESQKLLNEVAAAQSVLLDPQKKKEYDEQLRRRSVAAAVLPIAAMPLPTARPLRDSQPLPVLPLPRQQPTPLTPVVVQPALVQPQLPVSQPLMVGQQIAIQTAPRPVGPAAEIKVNKPAAKAASVKPAALSMALALAIGGGSAALGLVVLIATLIWAATLPAPKPVTKNTPQPKLPERQPPPKEKQADQSPIETPQPPPARPPAETAVAPSPPAKTEGDNTAAPRTGVIAYEKGYGNPLQYKLVLSPDGSRYFGVDAKGNVCIAHYVNGKPSHGFNGTSGVVFSPDGKRVAFWTPTNSIRIHTDGDSRQPGFSLSPGGPIRSLAFSEDGGRLAVAIAGPQPLQVFDLSTRSRAAPAISTSLPDVAWLGIQGDYVCCWSETGKAEIVSLSDPNKRMPVAEPMPQAPIGLTQMGLLALIRVNETVALHYWRPQTGKKWAEFQAAGLSDPADFLATSPEGSLVAVRQGRSLALVKVPGNKVLTRIEWLGEFRWAAISSGEKLLAMNAPQNYLWLLDVPQLLEHPAWKIETGRKLVPAPASP